MLYDFFLLLQNPRTRSQALTAWGLWTLVTSAGWVLAGFAGLPVGRVVIAEGSAGVILSVALNMGLLGALIGALIGASQWMFLRRRLAGMGWWIPATALGWGLGLPIALLINLLAGLGLSAALYGVVIGVALGMAQWLLLKKAIPPAGRWVWVNVVAMPVGVAVSGYVEQWLLTISSSLLYQVWWSSAVSGGIAGVFVGVLTGITLVALLARRPGA